MPGGGFVLRLGGPNPSKMTRKSWYFLCLLLDPSDASRPAGQHIGGTCPHAPLHGKQAACAEGAHGLLGVQRRRFPQYASHQGGLEASIGTILLIPHRSDYNDFRSTPAESEGQGSVRAMHGQGAKFRWQQRCPPVTAHVCYVDRRLITKLGGPATGL